MLLAIDTSTANASVALFDGFLRGEITWLAGQDHSRQLLPRIEEVLHAARVSPEDVTAVAVAVGPGSFNGLRVGLSTAKAICLARDLPIVGVDTPRVAAYPFRSTFRPVRPLFDAARSEVATALYREHGGQFATIEEPRLVDLAEALESSPSDTFFCGELTLAWRAAIGTRFGSESLARPGEEARRAGFLADLAWESLQVGQVDDLATIQPRYLRRPPTSGPARAIGSASR